jgi:Na+/melibiose symporter-like transporter
MAFATKDAAVINFVPFFFMQVVGLPGVLYGWAALIGQISDAVSDPILGTVSDNHRSRWGRRHPFMVIAIIPYAMCFYFLFAPPAGISPLAAFAWLAVSLVALRSTLTVFAVPHAALGAELSTDYEERSLIVSYRTILGWLAGIAIPWFALTFVFSRSPEGGDGRLLAANYLSYAWISMAVVVVTISACAWFTRSEIPHLPVPPNRRALRLLDPARDVREALGNRNFRLVFVAMLFVGASTGVAVTFALFVNTYFWEFTSVQVGAIIMASVIGNVAAFVLLRPAVKKFEKKQIYLASVGLMVVNGLWWIPGRLLGLLPENGAPILFFLALVNQFLLAAAVLVQQTITPAMIADIVDEHEVHTGERKDGVFFAAIGFSLKIPTGLGQFAGGLLLAWIAIPAGALPGSVAPEVLLKLGLVAGPAVSLSFLVPMWLLRRYGLTRGRHAELQDVLARRSGGGQTSQDSNSRG